MTDQNGWPDASKPGVPLNPEQFGAHRIRFFGDDETWLWHPRRNGWINSVGGFHSALDAGSAYGSTYLGPCHTPAEVAALIEAARREERDGLQASLDTIAAQRDAALKDGFLAGFREGAAKEREACAKVAEGHKGRYRTWPWWINHDGSEGTRNDSDIVKHADQIADAIRARGGA